MNAFEPPVVKWYGTNIEDGKQDLPCSIHLFMLNDTDTAAAKVIMSSNLLSAYRTASVPHVGTRHLAIDNVESVGIVGPHGPIDIGQTPEAAFRC